MSKQGLVATTHSLSGKELGQRIFRKTVLLHGEVVDEYIVCKKQSTILEEMSLVALFMEVKWIVSSSFKG